MDMTAHLNSETYKVIDRITGEEVPTRMFVKQVEKNGWEKAYVGLIADYIEAPGDVSCKVLAHFMRKKDRNNMVMGTHRSIADDLKVGLATVSRVIKKLVAKELLKKVRNGCYMVSPKMIGHGGYNSQMALMIMWSQ